MDVTRTTTRSTMAPRPSRKTDLGLSLEGVLNPGPLAVGMRAALAASLAILVALACGESGTAPVADSCPGWNTPAFFDRASVADVRDCLDAGESVTATDGDGRTPLHLAATRDDPAIVALLISAGARPDLKAEGMTPLCLAARDGRSAPVVRALLEGGSWVDGVCDIVSGSGRFTSPRTPLCLAVAWNTVEVVQTLLEAGASVGFVCSHGCDPSGIFPLTSPLYWAESSLRHPEHYRRDTEASQIIVDLLIAAGAKHGGGCD